jgi:hypothetical protein
LHVQAHRDILGNMTGEELSKQAANIGARHLPELADESEYVEADEVIPPELPYETTSGSDGSRSGELLAAVWPFEEGLHRLGELLERYPILSETDLVRAIELNKEIIQIINKLPTRPYPNRNSEPPSLEESMRTLEELRSRLDAARR